MSRPRRARWLTIGEVAAALVARYPALAERPRKRQLEAARRLVRRVERRDAARLTRRSGRDLYVSIDALSALLPLDVARLDGLDASIADLHQRHRQLERRVNGHGSQIRQITTRVEKTESFQVAAEAFLAAIALTKSG